MSSGSFKRLDYSSFGKTVRFQEVEEGDQEDESLLREQLLATPINSHDSRALSKVYRGVSIFLALTIWLVGLTAFFSSFRIARDTVSTTTTTSPNFVFILVDDMGYGSIGGGDDNDISFASTYMTSLAKKGIMMKNYYAQEICSPSRASLLTGRYPITLGMQYGEIQSATEWGVNTTEIFFPEVLHWKSNYKSYGIGKWNLGHYTAEYLPTARYAVN